MEIDYLPSYRLTYWDPPFWASSDALWDHRPGTVGKRRPKKFRKKERNRTDPRNSR